MNVRATNLHHQRVLQLALNDLNTWRFAPRAGAAQFMDELEAALPTIRAEQSFLEAQRMAVRHQTRDLPDDPDAFISWFESLKDIGPGQKDPLFPWLAAEADMSQMRWFLEQEVAGEAGFEDLTAITQVRIEGGAKLEMGRNFWDELGRGRSKGMHGPMLRHLAQALDLRPDPETTVWESLALANTMAGMAANRHFAYHSIGALGVIELTAPGRAAQVDEGLKRLGVPASDRHYFTLHSVLDVKHSQAWNEEVIRPLAERPEVRRALSEGALMRLSCGARAFERYRRELWC